MRLFRVTFASWIGLSVLAFPSVATGQEGWNDERTQHLVLEAIERRTAQLADTGLRDYTARAHGYLTFLAQLGEGFPDPPTVVKSDELMLEVYWAAPDRSKQRIIGRRDTLLLPTDIHYHRDHLGIIQNNFPAIIRLGDGDEVHDVPHPLSLRGFEVYDYLISDSLTIRSPGRTIEVMMVRVRPKDDRTPAAVGAVYIDRETASVVRMTFSFTRSALKDRQLEDVSVILENGLVDGRFWLPRRQEIEIRRSASWMDFPARGIIRGRWEICCVETNVDLPARTFLGSEIVEAPRAEQRSYPFEGTVLGTLPEEVMGLDAEEVRRVQEEARELVRAGALARTRSSSPAGRGVSDFVRFNRVEGLALGGGLTQRLGRGFSATGYGSYGFSDYAAKWRAGLDWRSATGWSVSLKGFDGLSFGGDVTELSGVRNSLGAQEFGSDWSNSFRVTNRSVSIGRSGVGGGAVELVLDRSVENPAAVNARPMSGAFAPALPADPLTGWRASIAIRQRFSAAGVNAELRLAGREVQWQGAEEDRYLRASLRLEGSHTVPGGAFVWRTIASGVSGGRVPIQDAVLFGGPVSGPGYAFQSLVGGVGVSQRLEWQQSVPFVSFDLGRFGKVPSKLTLAPYLHGVWIDRPFGGSEQGWFPSVGVGALSFFDFLRFDVARTLRGGERWMFSVDVMKEFWPVL